MVGIIKIWAMAGLRLVHGSRWAGLQLGQLLAAALNDFVELTAIKPDATTFRAVIKLNSVAMGDEKFATIYRTIHEVLPLFVSDGLLA